MGSGDEAEIRRTLSLLADNLSPPGLYYGLERQFWLDLWRAPCLDAVEECGIEVRHYGPILAFAIASRPHAPLFNLVLGAAQPGAVEDGHLGAALDWTESLGVDCRIPVRPNFGEPQAAEDHLNRRGYHRAATDAMFIRGAAPPDFPAPAGIEVDEIPEEVEGFGETLAAGYGLGLFEHGFFFGLPGQRDWRSYFAVGEEGYGIGAATMMIHYQAAQLGFAATEEESRGKGAHMALLRRRILDALAAGAPGLFAILEGPLGHRGEESPAARNLLRAGFALAATRTVWRPPDHLLAQPEDEDDEDDDFGDDDDDDFDGPEGPEGPSDHEFALAGSRVLATHSAPDLAVPVLSRYVS